MDSDIARTGIGSPQGDGCEFILYRHLPELVKHLNVDSMRIYLRAEEFLSDDDMEKLKPHPPDYVGSQIVETLVKLVKQNGTGGLMKFLSALKKSVDAGYHSGHKELLELLEKGSNMDDKSVEINVSLKEAGSNSSGLNNPAECDEEQDDDEVNENQSLVEGQKSRKRGKHRWCCDANNWCRDRIFKCIMLVATIFCLGIGIPQLTIGGMSAAANAAPDAEFNFILAGGATSGFYCQSSYVVAFHISVGIFLICVGLLLCTIMAWRAVGGSLSKSHECLHYVFVFTIAVLSILLGVSAFASVVASFVSFILTAVELFFITQAVYCNFVIIYWAFVEVVVILTVIGLGILMFIVYCIVFAFLFLLAWTDLRS